jgi:hypothetical protein
VRKRIIGAKAKIKKENTNCEMIMTVRQDIYMADLKDSA